MMSSFRSNEADLDSSVEEPEPLSSIDLNHGYQRLPVDEGPDSDYEGEDIENRAQNRNSTGQPQTGNNFGVDVADLMLKMLESEYQSILNNEGKLVANINEDLEASNEGSNEPQAEDTPDKTLSEPTEFKSAIEKHEQNETETQGNCDEHCNMPTLSSAQVQQVTATFSTLNLPPAPWEGSNAAADDWDKKVKMILGDVHTNSNSDE